MRQFAIQALVDERALWDAMRYLESIRAQGIVTRPYYLEGPASAEEAAPPLLNGKHRALKTTGQAAGARAAIFAALEGGGDPITSQTVKDKAGSKLSLKLINQTLRQLLTVGELKRVSHGQYVSAKPGSASPLALPAPNGSDTNADRARAAIAAALANSGLVTNKAIRASTGLGRGAVDSTFFQLSRDGYLKRIKPGTYAKGRKELAS